MAAPPKKDAGKGAAPSKKKAKPASRLYKVSGNKVDRVNKTCPKCGPGFFLAAHKDRETCGHCDYTQFKK